jgi:predicted nucleic acid-binding protein
VKKYVIDTNALISFVTDRNPKQQQIMKAILERVSQLKGLVLCHSHVLTEFVYVLDRVYRVPREEIKAMVQDFMLLPGVEVVQNINFKTLFLYWPEIIPDFGDALVATLCRAHKDAILVTFDHRFIRQIRKIGLTVYS